MPCLFPSDPCPFRGVRFLGPGEVEADRGKLLRGLANNSDPPLELEKTTNFVWKLLFHIFLHFRADYLIAKTKELLVPLPIRACIYRKCGGNPGVNAASPEIKDSN